MNFKEILADDINIFFNPEEFGELINFAGVDIIAIKSIVKFQQKYMGREEELGIYKGGLTLVVKKSDIPVMIEPMMGVEVDGISYQVINVEDIENIYKIDLAAYSEV